MRDSTILSLGSFLAALGVALGAFGAHALEGQVTETRLGTWETAVLYHLLHALALVALGAMAARLGRTAGKIAILFTIGIVLFSGSLYVLVLSDIGVLGAITPFGGTAFIAAWIWLAFTARRLHSPKK
ncbi:MAG: DUF423 domain-containing protein [Acidobacteriota bacterium]